MKKILTAAICFVAAAAVLTGCSSKRYNPEEQKTNVVENVPITITEEVFEVPEEQKVFEVDKELYSETDALKIIGYTGDAEELEIPTVLVHPTYGELPVVTVGEAAFLGNKTLKKVIVPDGITAINAGAFQSCSALTDVVLPEGLTTIGDSAFESSNLTNINIPSTVKTIGKNAFSTQLTATPWYKAQTAEKVIVGDGILLKYNGTGDVTFGEEVKAVAYYAFQRPGEINVTFESELESFDKMAVFEVDGTYLINFNVAYESNTETLVKSTPYPYTVYGAPEEEIVEEGAETEEVAEE